MGWRWFTAPFWLAALVVLVVRLAFLASGAEYTTTASEMAATAASVVGVGALIIVAVAVLVELFERLD